MTRRDRIATLERALEEARIAADRRTKIRALSPADQRRRGHLAAAIREVSGACAAGRITTADADTAITVMTAIETTIIEGTP